MTTDKELIALAPCPFCGSSNIDPKGWATLPEYAKTPEERSGPACDDCGASAQSIQQWNNRRAPLAATRTGTVAKAKKLYETYTDNHPTIHSNRFPIWDELSPLEKGQWLDKAAEDKELISLIRTELSAASVERDWTEDVSHENGNYECKCVHCGQMFIGHKRRVCCKACAAPVDAGEPVAWLIDRKIESPFVTLMKQSAEAYSSTTGVTVEPLYTHPPSDISAAAMREQCAAWHDEQAAIARNSTHCGDSLNAIASYHRLAKMHEESAAAIRALPTLKGPLP